MADITYWLQLAFVIWIVICGACSEKISPTSTQSSTVQEGGLSNCYAEAVYDELLKVIDIVKAHTYNESDGADWRAQPSKKFKKPQDDEDDGIEVAGLPLQIGTGAFQGVENIVQPIFKLVGSAITLNSSGLVEGSFGFLPMSVSNQITNALGLLAVGILGPGGVGPQGPTRPPVRRRRRTTTTTMATTSGTTNETAASPLSNNITDENSTMNSDLKLNNSMSDLDFMNDTSTEEGPTTTEVLFKESSLGENPVYAAAYAPNYVATTTSFPVYAKNFHHALYSAPTTTTVATTTTASTTSTDPNSYNIALPFDYMEGNIGNNVVDNIPPNVTNSPPPFQFTPSEYGSNEYEEQTEEAIGKV